MPFLSACKYGALRCCAKPLLKALKAGKVPCNVGPLISVLGLCNSRRFSKIGFPGGYRQGQKLLPQSLLKGSKGIFCLTPNLVIR